jgi:regulator of cell morphogenesis and NO signaling
VVVVAMEAAEHLAQLVDALRGDAVVRHHAPERRLVRELLSSVARLGPDGAAALPPLVDALDRLSATLRSHLEKEEHILFPAFAALAEAARQGGPRPPLPFPSVLHPIRVMEADHDRLAQALADLQDVVAGVVIPDAYRRAWSAWRQDLDRFADDLEAHRRLENDVLFPRALELERALL